MIKDLVKDLGGKLLYSDLLLTQKPLDLLSLTSEEAASALHSRLDHAPVWGSCSSFLMVVFCIAQLLLTKDLREYLQSPHISKLKNKCPPILSFDQFLQ